MFGMEDDARQHAAEKRSSERHTEANVVPHGHIKADMHIPAVHSADL